MTGRSRARRRAIALAVMATIVVLVADLTVRSFADGPDEQLAFLDEIRPLVEESTQHGLDLAQLRADAPTLDRRTFDRRLDRLVDHTAVTATAAAAIDPPPSLREAGALVVSSLSIRATATARLRAVLHDLLGAGTVERTAADLADLGSDLWVADRTYALFADAVGAADAEATVPPSAWVSDPAAWQPEGVTAFAVALRASGNLVTVTDAAVVTVQVAPSPVIAEGDVEVLATDDPLEVTVVVANRGSTRLLALPVVAELAVDGHAEVQQAQAEVDLDAGADRVVELGSLEPALGRGALLTVRVGPVPGETVLGDNEVQVRLRVRDPAEATTTTTTSSTTVPAA